MGELPQEVSGTASAGDLRNWSACAAWASFLNDLTEDSDLILTWWPASPWC